MPKKYFLLIAAFFGGLFLLQAQEEEKLETVCGTDQYRRRILANKKTYLEKQDRYEQLYRERMQQATILEKSAGPVYTIPVVVHIVHNGAPLGSQANPTDEQVSTIIEESSERFRHAHPGAKTYNNSFYGVDSEIELCLARQDTAGNYTSGVVRHYDPANAVGDYWSVNSVFDSLTWDKSRYCNLFIMSEMTNAAGVYLGARDFTIYDSDFFWSGLIAHELGHYFSLWHTFDAGPQGACPSNTNCFQDGDFVCDTPPKNEPGYAGGDCDNPANTCSTDDADLRADNPFRPVAEGGLGDQPDMLENYMDYTGGCWDSFTEGQKMRMRFNIETERKELINNSMACSGPALAENDAGITEFLVGQTDRCTPDLYLSFAVKNYGNAQLTSIDVVLELNGTPWRTRNLSDLSVASGGTLNGTFLEPITLPAGDYVLKLHTRNPNGQPDANVYNDAFYRQVSYFGGGDLCSTIDGCKGINPDTDNGPGNMTELVITGSFPEPSTDSVLLCATVNGDASFSGEVFDIFDEYGIYRGTTNFGNDCGGPTPEFCFSVSKDEYDQWSSDGSINLTFDPVSSQINPDLCGVNEICATVYIPRDTLATCTYSEPVVVINDTSVSSGVYWAEDSITSSGTVEAGSSVTFQAGQTITLQSGFTAEAGSSFRAFIADCSPAQAAAKATDEMSDIVSSPSEARGDVQLSVFPNPFRGQFTVSYFLEEPTRLQMHLYSTQGRLVRTLIDGEARTTGTHSLEVNYTDQKPGMYVLLMQTDAGTYTRKVVKTR